MKTNLEPLFSSFKITDEDIKSKIESLTKWLFTNASGKKFYYPYKPYALLTIMHNWNNDQTINIGNNFIQTYKDLLEKDPLFDKFPKKIKNSKDYCLLINPLGTHYYDRRKEKTCRRSNTFFERKDKKIDINVHFSKEVRSLIAELCAQCVLKCTNNSVLLNSDDVINTITHPNWEEIFAKTTYRIHQADWAQLIKNQSNNECLICKIKFCLEAAHIKPYSKCIEDNDNNEYNLWNGICLCSNCHRLFDKYLKIKKENDNYVFYIKKNIDEREKQQINVFLDKFNGEVNSLCHNQTNYICFFDYLVKLENSYI